MKLVRIAGGYLRIGRKKPGSPETGLPDEEDVVDPGYGVEGPEGEIPDPPPGIWPPVMPGNPVQPLPPGKPLPPGAIWPRPPGPVEGLFLAIVHIPNMGWHWVVIDPDAWTPEHLPEMPGQPQPKRP